MATSYPPSSSSSSPLSSSPTSNVFTLTPTSPCALPLRRFSAPSEAFSPLPGTTFAIAVSIYIKPFFSLPIAIRLCFKPTNRTGQKSGASGRMSVCEKVSFQTLRADPREAGAVDEVSHVLGPGGERRTREPEYLGTK